MQSISNKYQIVSHNEIILNDEKIPVTNFNPSLTNELVLKALQSRKFTSWLETLNVTEFRLESIEVRDIFLFGSIMGFICINCKMFPRHVPEGEVARPLPGYVFIRGDAIVILVIIKDKDTGKLYVVLTDQYRLPFGNSIIEFPAGMMDEERNFRGQAALELKQEAGIEIQPEDLHELITFGPSFGGCDEKITAFYCEIIRTHEEMIEIQKKIYGEHEEGEIIRLRIEEFDIDKILSLNKVHASGTLCALFAYQNLITKKL